MEGIMIPQALYNKKYTEIEKENKIKLNEVNKIIGSLKKQIALGYFECNDSVKDKYIELDWHGARLLYIKELNIIIPQLDKFVTTSINNEITQEKINQITNKILNVDKKTTFWNLISISKLRTLLSNNLNIPYLSNGMVQFQNKKTELISVSSSRITKGYNITDNSTYDIRDKSTYSDFYGIGFAAILASATASLNAATKPYLLPGIYLNNDTLESFIINNEMTVVDKEIDLKELASLEQEREQLKKNDIKVKFSNKEISDYLLSIDKRRADILEYDANILTDPNRGSWDLFPEEQPEGKHVSNINSENKIYSRDPRLDIKRGGIIAIDFGTKSTVVIQEDEDNHIYPLRIGSGNFSKAIKSKDFENPTVMEFIDINNFMSSYNDTLSRPNTSWNNLTVSHTASERVIEANSNEFSSIFSRLKQWCGEENHKTIIKDKKDYEFQLPNFLELAIDEKTINPIELYAYYIGLYINNMRNGVYLEYFLSFPVTYSLEVKEKIRLSFERGIKKSIPITILKDEELSKNIKVVQGCSEPAAYAVTALLEYDFQPELDDKIFYGVFDFGGGTTDFDFGIWREANFDDVNEERYDYIIEHFGSSGDRYLGGENILEHLAFEVFKNSANELLKSGIQFVKPIESNVFPGSEALLSNSQEANINSYKLMEALRPIWERHDGYDKEYSNGSLKVNLLDIKSKQHTQFELTLDLETVEKLIYNRIEQGVISFFEALKNVFHNNFSYNIDTINIFLAGNSSKSKVVKSLFKKYSDHISNDMDKKDVFKIFNPLGEDSSDHYKPNGKTGVAYGIIKTKAGGRIKVINHNTKNNNLDRFKYYIGKVRKDKLVPIITPDCEESWIRYFAATEREFEIFYTTNPKATTKKLEISESKKIRSSITKINSDASIYIKKTGTNKLNVVVAHEDGIENDIYLEEVGEFVLN